MSQRLKLKFYCEEEEAFEQYSQISEIHKYVTNDKYQARIVYKPKYVGKSVPQKNVLYLNLSAMQWSNWDENSTIVQKVRDDYFKICYATHNSSSELFDFVTYLKPKRIHLNVLPKSFKERQEMKSLMKKMQKCYMEVSDDEAENCNLTKNVSFKRLRNDETKNPSKKQKNC